MSLNIGRIIGIPVRIHYTLWLVLLLIAWSLAEGYMPQHYPGLGATTYWAIGIVSAIVLFVSVFLHELSHSYIAKKNGLPSKRTSTNHCNALLCCAPKRSSRRFQPNPGVSLGWRQSSPRKPLEPIEEPPQRHNERN